MQVSTLPSLLLNKTDNRFDVFDSAIGRCYNFTLITCFNFSRQNGVSSSVSFAVFWSAVRIILATTNSWLASSCVPLSDVSSVRNYCGLALRTQ